MKITINRFSSCAGKKRRFDIASNVRQTIESMLYHHRENLHFVVIHIGVISYPCNLRHGVSLAGEKAGDTDETQFIRGLREIAEAIYFKDPPRIKLDTRAQFSK